MQLKIQLAETDQRFIYREQEIYSWKEKLLSLFPNSSGIICSIINDNYLSTSRSNSSASSNTSDNTGKKGKKKEKKLSKSQLKKLSDFNMESLCSQKFSFISLAPDPFSQSKDSLSSMSSDKQSSVSPMPQLVHLNPFTNKVENKASLQRPLMHRYTVNICNYCNY